VTNSLFVFVLWCNATIYMLVIGDRGVYPIQVGVCDWFHLYGRSCLRWPTLVVGRQRVPCPPRSRRDVLPHHSESTVPFTSLMREKCAPATLSPGVVERERERVKRPTCSDLPLEEKHQLGLKTSISSGSQVVGLFRYCCRRRRHDASNSWTRSQRDASMSSSSTH